MRNIKLNGFEKIKSRHCEMFLVLVVWHHTWHCSHTINFSSHFPWNFKLSRAIMHLEPWQSVTFHKHSSFCLKVVETQICLILAIQIEMLCLVLIWCFSFVLFWFAFSSLSIILTFYACHVLTSIYCLMKFVKLECNNPDQTGKDLNLYIDIINSDLDFHSHNYALQVTSTPSPNKHKFDILLHNLPTNVLTSRTVSHWNEMSKKSLLKKNLA